MITQLAALSGHSRHVLHLRSDVRLWSVDVGEDRKERKRILHILSHSGEAFRSVISEESVRCF